MAFSRGPKIVTSGLVLALDAADKLSYPGSGTTWKDLSGNSNNGTLTNGPTFSAANMGTIVFDGVDDYVTGTLAASNSWTVSFWIYQTDINTKAVYYPFSGATSPVTGIGFGGSLDASTQNSWWYYDGSTVFSSSSTAITVNTWYYLTISHVYGAGTGTHNFYTNGVLSYSPSVADTTFTTYNVARRSDNNLYNIPGRIPIVKIYNRALSATEVLQNYNATKSRFGY